MNDPRQAFVESEVDHLFERTILNIGIPPCPDILARFMAEMRKDEPDYTRLENIICADVSISAGLIKTANSPFFGLRQPVRSGFEALTMLGMKMASRVVAGIVLRNSLPNSPNLERFWDSSARIAHLSGWLAQHLNIRGLRAEDAYTFSWGATRIMKLRLIWPTRNPGVASSRLRKLRCRLTMPWWAGC